MRKLLCIAATLSIIACVVTGPAAADESPQTQPTILRLLLYGNNLLGLSEILGVDWTGDDDDLFERTGFCVQYRMTGLLGEVVNAADEPEDDWKEECFETQERQVTFAAEGSGAEAKVRVNYKDDLHSPWSLIETATRMKEE
ncbi:MAG: hypothetical protein OXC11_00320 [Rhodospirillales bacterium]|nr:hypothetical protein [Rhodospirillales bacterium]